MRTSAVRTLSSAYFCGADLSRADLSDANLSGADLSRADLSDANLSDANLSGANLSGAYLRGAYLRGANLSGADLSGAYLSDANLSGANLSGANLGGANLGGADLGGANLRGADLDDAWIGEGVKWSTYIKDVVPALLTAGGKALPEQVCTATTWGCHSWQNCPMAEAFSVHDLSDIPPIYRAEAARFIQLFDADLIDNPLAPKSVVTP